MKSGFDPTHVHSEGVASQIWQILLVPEDQHCRRKAAVPFERLHFAVAAFGHTDLKPIATHCWPAILPAQWSSRPCFSIRIPATR